MKIMATFDGSPYAESILPQLAAMARLPNAEFTLVAIADEPHGRLRWRSRRYTAGAVDVQGGASPVIIDRSDPAFAETKNQAVERRLSEISDYLHELIETLPTGPRYEIETKVANDAAGAIINIARQRRPDVIVMATHGQTGLARTLFGSVTEDVLRSSVAPVLVVHPDEVKSDRRPGS